MSKAAKQRGLQSAYLTKGRPNGRLSLGPVVQFRQISWRFIGVEPVCTLRSLQIDNLTVLLGHGASALMEDTGHFALRGPLSPVLVILVQDEVRAAHADHANFRRSLLVGLLMPPMGEPKVDHDVIQWREDLALRSIFCSGKA